jgi:hypothetical protein
LGNLNRLKGFLLLNWKLLLIRSKARQAFSCQQGWSNLNVRCPLFSHNSHTQFFEFFTHFSQNFSSNYVVSVIYLKNTWTQIIHCIILHGR